MNKILEVKRLKVFPLNEPNRLLVKDISFELYPGRITCIVGESGSGKSLSALSIMKLLSHQLKQTGDILFQGKNISNLSKLPWSMAKPSYIINSQHILLWPCCFYLVGTEILT